MSRSGCARHSPMSGTARPTTRHRGFATRDIDPPARAHDAFGRLARVGGVRMDWKNDEVLKALLEKGKQSGSLTFDEVNQALPELSEPDRLAEITEFLMDQHGIQLIDGDEEDESPVNLAEEILQNT